MSELAYNINGEGFEPPETATGWRVRRMKARGAPEVGYKDGLPLVIPIESDLDELRRVVDSAGRFRLDPVDDRGRNVEGSQPAYVVVPHKVDEVPPASAEAAPVPAKLAGTDGVVAEAMRLNTELARSVIDRFPEMMHAAAVLLRAADGAGLPAREPRAIEDEEDDEDGDDEAPAASSSPTFELINTLVAQIVPVIVTGLAGKKLPSVAEMLDWRKVSPKATPAAEPVVATNTVSAAASQPAPAARREIPPLDPATMAKVVAIQSQLTPEEGIRARQLAGELSPAELHAWFEELSALPVPDAVAKIRSLLGGAS